MALSGSINQPFNLNIKLSTPVPSGGDQKVYVYSENTNISVTNNALLEFDETNWNVEQQTTVIGHSEGQQTIKVQSSGPYTCELKSSTATVDIIGGFFDYYSIGSNDAVTDWIEVDGKYYMVGRIRNLYQRVGQCISYSTSTGLYAQELNVAASNSVGIYNQISNIEPDGNGGFYISGTFDSLNGQPVTSIGIAHVSSTGVVSSLNHVNQSVNYNILESSSDNINFLKLIDDTLFIGVVSSSYSISGNVQRGMISYDVVENIPSPQQVSVTGINFYSGIQCIDYDDTHLYVGGRFTNINGQLVDGLASLPRSNISAINTDMMFDISSTVYDLNIESIHVKNDIVYVGGYFNEVDIGGTATRNGAFAINNAANWDTITPSNNLKSWDINAGGYTLNTIVRSIISDPNNSDSLMIGGSFNNLGPSSTTARSLAIFKDADNFTGTDADLNTTWQPYASETPSYNGGLIPSLYVIGNEVFYNTDIIDATTGDILQRHHLELDPPSFNNLYINSLKNVNGINVICGNQITLDQSITRNDGCAFTYTTGDGKVKLDNWDPEIDPGSYGIYGTSLLRINKKDNNTAYITGPFSTIKATTRRGMAEIDLNGFGTLNSFESNISTASAMGVCTIDPSRNRLICMGAVTASSVNYNGLFAINTTTGVVSSLITSSGFSPGLGILRVIGDRLIVYVYSGNPYVGAEDVAGKIVDIDLTDDTRGSLDCLIGTSPNSVFYEDHTNEQASSLNKIDDNKIDGMVVDESTNSLYVIGEFTVIGNVNEQKERMGLARINYNTGDVMEFFPKISTFSVYSGNYNCSSSTGSVPYSIAIDGGCLFVFGLVPKLDAANSYPYYAWAFNRYTGEQVSLPTSSQFHSTYYLRPPSSFNVLQPNNSIPLGGYVAINGPYIIRLPTISPSAETGSTLVPVIPVYPKIRESYSFSFEEPTYLVARDAVNYDDPEASYHLIQLSSQPATDTTVTITCDNPAFTFRNSTTDGLSTWSRVFTTANWDDPEYFRVSTSSSNDVGILTFNTDNGTESVSISSGELVSFSDGGPGFNYYPEYLENQNDMQFNSYNPLNFSSSYGNLHQALIDDGVNAYETGEIDIYACFNLSQNTIVNYFSDPFEISLNTSDPIDLYVGGISANDRVYMSRSMTFDGEYGGSFYVEYVGTGTGTMQVNYSIRRKNEGYVLNSGVFYICIGGACELSGSGAGSGS